MIPRPTNPRCGGSNDDDDDDGDAVSDAMSVEIQKDQRP